MNAALKFYTSWPADSVEFCPNDDDILVCGTYHLETTKETQAVQRRRGKCLVLRLEENALSQLQAIDLPAVLDLKWCPRSSTTTPILGIADSEGNISLHEWLAHENRLSLIQRLPCATDDVLCLSIDWSNRRSPTNGLGNLIVSLSTGHCHSSSRIPKENSSSQTSGVPTNTNRGLRRGIIGMTP